MLAIYDIFSAPESEDEQLVALFTTEKKCDAFMLKLKIKFPKNEFIVADWHDPIIDPKELNEVFPS